MMRTAFTRILGPAMSALTLVLVALGTATPLCSQPTREPVSRFVDVGDVRLHYLDFGGEGLPVILLHSKPWDAWTYDGFAQRFATEHRVLAPTLRGSGDSEGTPSDVETDGEDILRFMDVVGIDRAVLVGNSTPGLAMTYLAERHSERVAGLVFLAPGLPLGDFAGADSLRIWEMTLRAQGDNYRRTLPQASYRPRFRSSAQPTIPVPALIFRNQEGGSGGDAFNVPRMLLEGQIPVEDSEAARFWEDARATPGFGQKLDEFWVRLWATEPASFAEFDRAFSEPPTVIRLPVAMVGGYEYREAPDLVEPHLWAFLRDIAARERQ